MKVGFRFAEQADIVALLPLMNDFYALEQMRYDAEHLQHLVQELIADQRLGRLILFEESGRLAGYMVLGFGFSLEFHGRDCYIDEFYVVPEKRSQGIGQTAVEFAVGICREVGIKALHLEAGHANMRGHQFYKRLGFKDHARHLMTRWL